LQIVKGVIFYIKYIDLQVNRFD